MSRFTRRLQRGAASVTRGSNGPRVITHGDQLTPADVGPWALQETSKGSEVLDGSLIGPSRGYWRFDTPDEFSSGDPWPATATDANPAVLNDPSLHAGVVTGSPITIDGYSIPVGTRIVQFRLFPDGYPFYAQSTSLKILFRGCRFRWTDGVGGESIFNDAYSTSMQQIMVHYCDIGLLSLDPPDGSEGIMHLKFIGGSGHRALRNYHTRSSTFYQPNAPGCEFTENYVDEYIYPYGESGPDGDFGSDAGHLNGISSEGVMTSIAIKRNHICAPSPDGSTGSTGSAVGQIGYGTQPGQTGYGNGSNPGRLIGQTDNVALFTNVGDNHGSTVGSLLIQDNYLGGTGYCIYAGGTNGTNITVTGNKFTTKWYTNGGSYGPVAATPSWGSGGNVQSNNTWADDYGSGGDGATALVDRQYPAGNGPRKGTSAF